MVKPDRTARRFFLTRGWRGPALFAAFAHVGLALLPVGKSQGSHHTTPQLVKMVIARAPEPPPVLPAEEVPAPQVEAAVPPPPRRAMAKRAPVAEQKLALSSTTAVEPATQSPQEIPVSEAPQEAPAEKQAQPEPAPAPAPVARAAAAPPAAATAVDLGPYRRGLSAALTAHKRYPMVAERMGLEGRAVVRLTIGRDGHLKAPPRLVTSTGHAVLDEEVLRMVAAAVPFKPLPSGHVSGQETFDVAVVFELSL